MNHTPLFNTHTGDWEVIYTDGDYRFVNHSMKICTIGFKSRESLEKYRNEFLATESAKIICQKRYRATFPTSE